MSANPALATTALVLALAAAACPLAAQDTTAAAAAEWWIGGSLGIPGHRGQAAPAVMTFGAHFLRVPAGAGPSPASLPGRLGLDLSVGTAPYALALGSLTAGARAGVVVPLRIDSLLVLPGGGLSGIGSAHDGGLDALTGYHVGVAVVHTSGPRLGLTLHWLAGEPVPFWLIELGALRRPGW